MCWRKALGERQNSSTCSQSVRLRFIASSAAGFQASTGCMWMWQSVTSMSCWLLVIADGIFLTSRMLLSQGRGFSHAVKLAKRVPRGIYPARNKSLLLREVRVGLHFFDLSSVTLGVGSHEKHPLIGVIGSRTRRAFHGVLAHLGIIRLDVVDVLGACRLKFLHQLFARRPLTGRLQHIGSLRFRATIGDSFQ